MQILSLDMNQSLPSSGLNSAVIPCENELPKDGSVTCTSTAETCGNSILLPGPAEWIASQRASLVRIFRQRELVRELQEQEAALSRRYSEQLTLFDLASFGSKTPHGSEPEAGIALLGNLWRVDTPGETESLGRLMSALPTKGTGGGVLLPILTVCGNWNRKGASLNSGDGIATALKRLPTILATDADDGGPNARDSKGRFSLSGAIAHLPTLTASMATWADFMQARFHSSKRPEYEDAKKMLPTLTVADGTGGLNLRTAITMLPTVCATDYKSPYSAEGYEKQTQQRSKPLRDTLVHSTGHRLTSAFAEWWMGWPLGWTATQSKIASKLQGTGKSR